MGRVRGTPVGAIRVRSPVTLMKSLSKKNSIRINGHAEELETFSSSDHNGSWGMKFLEGKTASFGDGSRKIVVVVDSSSEARGALHWVLSHSAQCQDTILLLYVTKPAKQGSNKRELNQRAYGLLHSLKNMCQSKRPEVQVEVALVEGKDKGPTILEESKRQRASLLVLGQRKQSMLLRLRRLWAGTGIRGGAVEYCIQNSSCMAIAVRRKGKKHGGYLITTKRHKNFWLLA